jgi:hypothetical protein
MRMKRDNVFIVCTLGLLLVAIFSLSIRNDFSFNEELRIKNREILQRDSLMQAQMDCITISLKEVSVQLDSIRRDQKEYNRIENLNTDTIKASLFQIKRISNRIHNLVK